MNENGRYIWIGVGAVLLMAAGLLISYTWKKNQGVHAQDSDLTLQDLSLSGSSDSIVSMPQDSIKADSLAALAKKRNQILNEVRHIADGEGFRWQTALKDIRFREPAEALLPNLEQDGAALRDSLEQAMATDSIWVKHLAGHDGAADSLLLFYDEHLNSWQQRLSLQIELLPTALQALEAQQITNREYSTILKQVKTLEKKRKQ